MTLSVEEGSRVKQGDLIAVLDPSELEAEDRAAVANVDSMKSKVNETQSTLQGYARVRPPATCANAEARLAIEHALSYCTAASDSGSNRKRQPPHH